MNTYNGTCKGEAANASEYAYIAATAELFLKIREAHEARKEIIVNEPK